MRSIEVSDKELEVIILGLRARETQMFNYAATYKDQGNKIAQMACIQEWRIAKDIRERLEMEYK